MEQPMIVRNSNDFSENVIFLERVLRHMVEKPFDDVAMAS